MTNQQKEQITALRLQGYGYTTIANAVGISKDSVKAYCRRHGLGGKVADNSRIQLEKDMCLNCGTPLSQAEGKKKKKFCSDACRTAWWNSHQDCVHRKAVYEYTCAHCGTQFTAYGNAGRKYCSHSCYIAHRFGGDGDVCE